MTTEHGTWEQAQFSSRQLRFAWILIIWPKRHYQASFYTQSYRNPQKKLDFPTKSHYLIQPLWLSLRIFLVVPKSSSHLDELRPEWIRERPSQNGVHWRNVSGAQWNLHSCSQGAEKWILAGILLSELGQVNQNPSAFRRHLGVCRESSETPVFTEVSL